MQHAQGEKANRWRQREATGDMIIVRYADNSTVCHERTDSNGGAELRG